MAQLSQTLNAGGVDAQLASKDGFPILIVGLGDDGVMQIGGPACGRNPNAECSVLEFAAVLSTANKVSDRTIAQIDRKFELASVERTDASHVLVTDGMVLMGGVTIENIAANIGFFIGQCRKISDQLAVVPPGV